MEGGYIVTPCSVDREASIQYPRELHGRPNVEKILEDSVAHLDTNEFAESRTLPPVCLICFSPHPNCALHIRDRSEGKRERESTLFI